MNTAETESNCMNTEDAESYCMRNYGLPMDKCELEEYDIKLIKAITKFKASYAEQISKRKCTMYIPIESCPVSVPETIKHKKVVKAPTEVLYCKATKMDGNPCTAKAKPGCEFCGRHNKIN